MVEESSQTFHRLGAGSFATVYACPAWAAVAVKQGSDPSRAPDLQREYDVLCRLCALSATLADVQPHGHLFSLPRGLSFYDSFAALAESKDIKGDAATARMGPGAVYLMERVWPVPPKLAGRIRTAFFPPAFKQDTTPFVCRLYLGGREQPAAAADAAPGFFHAMNFPLTPDRLSALDQSCEKIAAGMASSLAFIHFGAVFDGRGVEFVLCGSPRDPSERHSFYAIDFDQMRPLSGDAAAEASQIADAVWSNDPYVPRPGSTYWDVFSAAYTVAAVSFAKVEVAKSVLAALEAHWPTAAAP